VCKQVSLYLSMLWFLLGFSETWREVVFMCLENYYLRVYVDRPSRT